MPTAVSNSAATANAPANVVVRRGCATVSAIQSSRRRRSRIGWAGSMSRTAARIAGTIVCSCASVRITRETVSWGNCAEDRYSIALGSRSRPPPRAPMPSFPRTAPTTPTTSWRRLSNSTTRPIAFASGHNRRAMSSLTIATSGEPGRSCASNSRPARSGTPSARNRPGLTTCSTAVMGASEAPLSARSRSVTPRRTPGANGALVMRPTARTNGSVSSDPSNV
jgi:hypothetical protein